MKNDMSGRDATAGLGPAGEVLQADAVGGNGPQLPPQAIQLCAEDAARAGDELGGIDEVGVPARMNANGGAEFSRPSPGRVRCGRCGNTLRPGR